MQFTHLTPTSGTRLGRVDGRGQAWRRGLALGLAVPVVGMALAATPAQAASGPTCNGWAGWTTINGTLTVPEGAYCQLDHVTVNGDIAIQRDANLVITSSTVHGGITEGEYDFNGHVGGYLNSWNTTVDKDINLANVWGAYLSQTRVTGSVVSKATGHSYPAGPSKLYVGDSTRIGGNLTMFSQNATLKDVSVRGDTWASYGAVNADHLTTSSLTAGPGRFPPGPVDLVMGRSTVTGNTQLGSGNFTLGSADGTVGPNTLNGSLSVAVIASAWTPRLEIVGNTVKGMATFNDVFPAGPRDWTIRDNAFLGGAEGVFAQQPVSPTTASVASLAATKAQSGKSTGQIKAESAQSVSQLQAKKAEVVKKARAHGKARFR